MRFGKLVSTCLFAAGLAAGVPGQAATLFSDNFDTDSPTTVLNFGGLSNWTVSNGTIDYIRQGGFGLSCAGGAGGCLDMDGSTSNAGRITSNSAFALTGGVNYTLSALLSGNQRSGAADSVTIGIVDANTNALLASQLVTLNGADAFSSHSMLFVPVGNVAVRLTFEGAGGDNVGLILDNVLFADDSNGRVPEPGSLALLGLAAAAAGFGRRRKPD